MARHIRRRPPVPPLPIAELIRDPAWLGLPSAGRGAAITLLMLHWQGADLPKSDMGLRTLAGAHNVTWVTHRKAIRALIERQLPILDAAAAARAKRAHHLIDANLAAIAARRAARLAATAAPAPTVANSPAPIRQLAPRRTPIAPITDQKRLTG